MVTSFADIRLASLLASVVRRPFCFWVRGPELRLWGFGHWVPLLIFLSGLEGPPGAIDRGTPLEDSPSSSAPLKNDAIPGELCGTGVQVIQGEHDKLDLVDAILVVTIGIDRLHQKRYRCKRQA